MLILVLQTAFPLNQQFSSMLTTANWSKWRNRVMPFILGMDYPKSHIEMNLQDIFDLEQEGSQLNTSGTTEDSFQSSLHTWAPSLEQIAFQMHMVVLAWVSSADACESDQHSRSSPIVDCTFGDILW